MTGCRDCQHWQVSETLKANRELALQGFASCAVSKAKHTYMAAGWHCREWVQATAEAIDKRIKHRVY